MTKYNPTQAGVKTKWHDHMQYTLDQLVKGVLNRKSITREVYLKMNVPKTLASIGECDVNILAVGAKHSWIINARTVHPEHFVGTRLSYGYDSKLGNYQNWPRLEE